MVNYNEPDTVKDSPLADLIRYDTARREEFDYNRESTMKAVEEVSAFVADKGIRESIVRLARRYWGTANEDKSEMEISYTMTDAFAKAFARQILEEQGITPDPNPASENRRPSFYARAGYFTSLAKTVGSVDCNERDFVRGVIGLTDRVMPIIHAGAGSGALTGMLTSIASLDDVETVDTFLAASNTVMDKVGIRRDGGTLYGTISAAIREGDISSVDQLENYQFSE